MNRRGEFRQWPSWPIEPSKRRAPDMVLAVVQFLACNKKRKRKESALPQ